MALQSKHYRTSILYCRYKEVTYKASVDLAKALKATLGIDVADKQAVMVSLDKDLPLVEVDPNAQLPVEARFGAPAKQSTIDIVRHPLKIICCGKWAELGDSAGLV